MLKVSVIINTYNRCTNLVQTLNALKYLNYSDFEVIVVNGPSTDDTAKVLDKYKKDIKIGHCPEKNLAMSRNIGITIANGDIIAFIDDDAIPEPEWLDDLVNGYDNDEIAGVGGLVYDHTGYNFQYKYVTCDRFGNANFNRNENPTPYYNIPGANDFVYIQGTNSSFKKEPLLEVGGFDEQYDFYLDETDLCVRLIDAGYVIKIIENGFVHHKFAPSHIRDNKRFTKKRYSILKNTAYFAIKSSYRVHSFSEVIRNLSSFMEFQSNDIMNARDHELLTWNEYVEFWQDLNAGTSQGFFDAITKTERKLLDKNNIDNDFSTYKRYPKIMDANKKLKICFLSKFIDPKHGGIARFTYALASGLGKMGHTVHLITLGEDHNTVNFEDGVWIHRIVPESRKVVNLTDEFGVSQFNTDYSYAIYQEILRINNNQKIDLVEAPIWDNEGFACLLDGKIKTVINLETTIKIVMESHKEWEENPDIQKQIEIEALTFKNAKHFHAISKAIVDKIEKTYNLKIDDSKIGYVPLGLPDKSNEFLSNRADDNIELLFVGRLEHRKGIDVLLECIPSICEKYKNVIFRIVGDDSIPSENGKTYKELFLAKQNGKDFLKQIFFEGKVNEDTLYQHYANCDIFVAPSRFESFGLIFLEAMMFSKPVIGCNVGGMIEIIKDKVNGFLAEPGDKASLQNSFETLIKNDSLRLSFGKISRKMYETKFTDLVMLNNLINFYNKILLNETV